MAFRRDQPFNDLPPLPPDRDLESKEVLRLTVNAARSLAKLRGDASRMPNQEILVNGLVLQEARLSSEIENIVTTSDELYRAAANPEEASDPQLKEVLGYREALWYGIRQLKIRPVCTNLYVETVSILRGIQMEVRRVPGTTLKNQAGEVIYTPPMGEDLIRSMLGNVDEYIHAEHGPDPLIRLAVMHYQFEAIHPFTDGNGRTGRIMNILYLVEQGLLDWPVLYLSQYILQHKTAYYAGLRAITEEQHWEEWICFILVAIQQTAEKTAEKVRAILQAMEETATQIKTQRPRMYSKDLIEAIFTNPYCRIRFLEKVGLGSRITVTRYLQELAKIGVLREVRIGRELYYLNDALTSILSQ